MWQHCGVQRAEAVAAAASAGATGAALASENRRLRIENNVHNKAASPPQLEYPSGSPEYPMGTPEYPCGHP